MAVVAQVFLAVACGGGQHETSSATAPSGAEARIGKVRLRGNRHVDSDEILSGLSTRGPSGLFVTSYRAFDPLQAELDRKRIESFYAGRGYFSAKVTEIAIRKFIAPRVGHLIEVVFVVEEGRRSLIDEVAIMGVPDHLSHEVTRTLVSTEVQIGEPFVYSRYSEAKDKIKSLLMRHGYAFASVGGRVKVDRSRVVTSVDILVESGPRARFGRVSVLGLRDMPERSVLTRVSWQSGQVFDPRLIEETRTRLLELASFSVIRIDYERATGGDRADVIIRVTESFRRELKAGGGVGIDRAHYEIRGRAGYMQRAFLHPLATLRLDLRPAVQFLRGVSGAGQFGGAATAGVDRHDFLYPRTLQSSELTYLVTSLDAYSIQGPLVRFAVQRPFVGDRLHVSLAWQFRLRSFFRIDDAITQSDRDRLGIVNPYRLGLFEQTIAYDGRDDPLNPRVGFYAEMRVEQAGIWAGSAFDYVRAIPEVRGFVPFGPRLVGAARIRFGGLLSGGLPITQRFFAGGANSQRGFSQQRLAPFVVDAVDKHVPVGGEALLESSAELRADVKRLYGNWLGVVAFIDGADVTDELDQLEVLRLHWAAGAGLRYRTPVGALRLDLGFRLNRTGADQPDPGDTWAFHFSLGEAF